MLSKSLLGMNQISDNCSLSQQGMLDQMSTKQQELQSRLNSYFENRKASKEHNRTGSNNTHRNLNGNNPKPYSTQTMDFKILFTKGDNPPSQTNKQDRLSHKDSSADIVNNHSWHNRENRDDVGNRGENRESEKRRKGVSEYSLNKREVKESLSKKKLNLMEYKMKQLEQEVELELQKKIDVYKQNEQLEREIARVNESIKMVGESKSKPKGSGDDEFNYEILELEGDLRREKERNKNMKKEIQELRQRKKQRGTRTEDSVNKNTYESQKNTLEIERLKVELEEERNNYRKLKQKFESNQEFKSLSSELKKLRKMVQVHSIKRRH